MRPLADADFNPELPLQTIPGTKQALRCSKSTVLDLVARGLLDAVDVNTSTRITTDSIFRLISQGRRQANPRTGREQEVA
jgi:hypothetical protein